MKGWTFYAAKCYPWFVVTPFRRLWDWLMRPDMVRYRVRFDRRQTWGNDGQPAPRWFVDRTISRLPWGWEATASFTSRADAIYYAQQWAERDFGTYVES